MEQASDITPENTDTPVPEEGTPEPKKKRVWLKRILWTFCALFALILLVVAFFLGPIAKTVVNKIGASTLGVDKMSVDSITIYPFGGYVRVENFVVGKPVGDAGTSFSYDLVNLDYFECDFAVRTVLSQKKVIDTLQLKNLILTYEKLLNGKTNVGEILARFEPKEDAAPAEKTEKKGDSDKKTPDEEIYLAAHYVDIENINVRAYIAGVPSAPIPPISVEFKDGIGLDENLTPLQFGLRFAGNFMSLIRIFQGSLIGDFTGATVDAVSDAAGFTANVVSDAAKGTATVVTDVAGVTADAAGATVSAVGDAAEATAEAVSDTAKKVFNIFSSDDKENSDNKK